jgi:phenylacetaldehyde dehydrogenase
MTDTSWTTGLALKPEVAHTTRSLFIGGHWQSSVGGESISVIDPSTEAEVATITRGNRHDVDRAVAAARKAFDSGPWSKMTGVERAKLLWRLADAIEANADELGLLETIDGGKPLAMSRAFDTRGAAEKLRYTSGWASKIFGETFGPAQTGNFHAYTSREPIGVAALIVPWNFPLNMAMAKLSEALTAGCTAIIKPAEQTSLATLRLCELIQSVGIPEGVVNLVTGYGPEVGQALAEHPGVDKVSFTGSTAVGKQLVATCAQSLKRVTLELGGKSPAFVFGDADLDIAVQSVSRNIFYNAGQVCSAGSRVYAHRSIYDRLVAALSGKAQSIRVGPGIDPLSELGPLISDRQFARVSRYVETGVSEGATVVTGGQRHGSAGYFLQPTILADTDASMTVRREEIFGPVLCITPFEEEDLETLAAEANNTEYGLSSYVYTRDLSTAHRMAKMIKAGTVRVNGAGLDFTVPFGGFKQSGWGREHGRDGVLGYTELKSVIMAL